MKFCLLASGSKGNAVWVEAFGTAILIDNGLSGRELKRRLALQDLDLKLLRGIFVTHEHWDHLQGVSPLAKSLKLKVFTTQGTVDGAPEVFSALNVETVDNETLIEIGPLQVKPFSISHDTGDPVGFVVESDDGRLGLATDLGQATALVRTRLSKLNALILESNHDPKMLHEGPYPWPLKQRVKGRAGHLSNQEAAALLASLVHKELKQVVLAHLSAVNNDPQLALANAKEALTEWPDLPIDVARQDIPTKVFEF